MVRDCGLLLALSSCSTTPLSGRDEHDTASQVDAPSDVHAATDGGSGDGEVEDGRAADEIAAFRRRYGFDPRELESQEWRGRLLWSRRLLAACPDGPLTEPARDRWLTSGGLMITDSYVIHESSLSCDGGPEAPGDSAYAQLFAWDAVGYRLQSEYLVDRQWNATATFPHAHARVWGYEHAEGSGYEYSTPGYREIRVEGIVSSRAGFSLPPGPYLPVGTQFTRGYMTDDWHVLMLPQDVPGLPPPERSMNWPTSLTDQTTWFVNFDETAGWSIAHVEYPPADYLADPLVTFSRTVLNMADGWALMESGPHRQEDGEETPSQTELWRLDGGVEIELVVPDWADGEANVTTLPKPEPVLSSFLAQGGVYVRTESGWSESPELVGGPWSLPGGIGAVEGFAARQEWAFEIALVRDRATGDATMWLLPFVREDDGWHCLGAIDMAEAPGRPGRPALVRVLDLLVAMREGVVLLYFTGYDVQDEDPDWQHESFLYAFQR